MGSAGSFLKSLSVSVWKLLYISEVIHSADRFGSGNPQIRCLPHDSTVGGLAGTPAPPRACRSSGTVHIASIPKCGELAFGTPRRVFLHQPFKNCIPFVHRCLSETGLHNVPEAAIQTHPLAYPYREDAERDFHPRSNGGVQGRFLSRATDVGFGRALRPP